MKPEIKKLLKAVEKRDHDAQHPNVLADFVTRIGLISESQADVPKLVAALRHFTTYADMLLGSTRHKESAATLLDEVEAILKGVQ